MREDAEQHLNELADCLTQSARPVSFLLGAGTACAVKNGDGEPLIPDIVGLTKSVSDSFKASPHKGPWETLLGTCVQDGDQTPTIEAVLDRIRGLKQYAGSATVRGLTKAELQSLEESVCEHIGAVASVELPDTATPYRSLALWTKANKRLEAVEIFTTNYDLLTEQALERAQVPTFDGFVGSSRPFFDVESVSNDALPARWTRIWKMHGSTNWHRDVARKEIYRSDKGGSGLIHPSNLKYDESRKLPYLALMERLRRFLRSGQPVLVCSGYSFRDQHINELIVDTLGANPTAVVFGLLYGSLAGYPEAATLAARAANLRLYAADGCIVSARSHEWQTQKSKPEAKLPAGIIDWVQDGGDAANWRPTVNIGDFVRLGDLLYHVSKGRYATDPMSKLAAS